MAFFIEKMSVEEHFVKTWGRIKSKIKTEKLKSQRIKNEQSKRLKINGEKGEIPTNGSTGQREKAPAEPVCLITLNQKQKRRKRLEWWHFVAESPGVAGAWQHGQRKRRGVYGVAFGAGEINWWSSLEEWTKFIEIPQTKEASRVVGFMPRNKLVEQ